MQSELRSWKITATEMALKEQDVARAPLISSSDEEEESLLVSDEDEKVNAGADLLMLGESDSGNEPDDKPRDSLSRAAASGLPSPSNFPAGSSSGGAITTRRSKHRVAVETARTFAASDVNGLDTEEIPSQGIPVTFP